MFSKIVIAAERSPVTDNFVPKNPKVPGSLAHSPGKKKNSAIMQRLFHYDIPILSIDCFTQIIRTKF